MEQICRYKKDSRTLDLSWPSAVAGSVVTALHNTEMVMLHSLHFLFNYVILPF